MKKTICYAVITPDYSADINGNSYRLGEITEAEYGAEWDGDVVGYIANASTEEYDLREGCDFNLDWGTLTGAENIHALYVNGKPAELWFFRSSAEPARISIDNGRTFVSPEEAIAGMGWDTIVNLMDNETRESVAADLAPCTEIEFLTEYLRRANDNLIIG